MHGEGETAQTEKKSHSPADDLVAQASLVSAESKRTHVGKHGTCRLVQVGRTTTLYSWTC